MRVLRIVSLIVVAVLLGAGRLTAQAPVESQAAARPSEAIVVQLRPGAVIPSSYQATPVALWPGWYVLTADGKTAQEMLADATQNKTAFQVAEPLEYATVPQGGPDEAGEIGEPFSSDTLPLSLNDPLYAQQYSHERMSVGSAQNITTGQGVTVAILDTGMDFTHPDLSGQTLGRGKDFVAGDDDATDEHGHGTHVAGIVAAKANNGIGVVGVAPNASLLIVRVLDASGGGSYPAIASGIRYAVDGGADVINMSLGGPCSGTSLIGEAVNYAVSKGVVVIAAAGNSNSSTPSCPAALPGVLGIGATDSADHKASFSNYGPSNVKVSAPGAQVLSTVRGARYEAWNGTSMAAPNAAGVAALVRAAHPDWSASQVMDTLLRTADDVIGNPQMGTGRINAARAVGANPTPPSPPAPSPTPPYGPQPTPPTSSCGSVGDIELKTVCLINEQRRANGNLPPLSVDNRLGAAADAHNATMRDQNCFSHQCPGEADYLTRIRQSGYAPLLWGGEIIARGQTTPERAVTDWMNSAGHRAIILDNRAVHIGCGYLAPFPWWTCAFGALSGYTPPPTFTPLPPATPRPGPTPTPPGLGAPLPLDFYSPPSFAILVTLTDNARLVAAKRFCTEFSTVYLTSGPGCLWLDRDGRMTSGNSPPASPAGTVVLWGFYFTTLHMDRVAELERLTGHRANSMCPYGGRYAEQDDRRRCVP